MVPSVAMKGGNLNLPTKMPFAMPTIRQLIIVIKMASGAAIPLVISVADIMALMPTTDPMERSILPVINT
ncbi:hypothetical protein SDC9_185017 [bioreactor metagenome]|uniref:Uncharacterized protein n=1 Tax=bioreactor metagenome TaxID=1076179 RepID=A0A645HEN7_9ZZZZ